MRAARTVRLQAASGSRLRCRRRRCPSRRHGSRSRLGLAPCTRSAIHPGRARDDGRQHRAGRQLLTQPRPCGAGRRRCRTVAFHRPTMRLDGPGSASTRPDAVPARPNASRTAVPDVRTRFASRPARTPGPHPAGPASGAWCSTLAGRRCRRAPYPSAQRRFECRPATSSASERPRRRGSRTEGEGSRHCSPAQDRDSAGCSSRARSPQRDLCCSRQNRQWAPVAGRGD